MTDEARLYYDTDGERVTLDVLCMREPAWAANRIRALKATLADLFALIDEGQLVRSTANDADPDWHMKSLRFVHRLAKAQANLEPESSANTESKQ